MIVVKNQDLVFDNVCLLRAHLKLPKNSEISLFILHVDLDSTIISLHGSQNLMILFISYVFEVHLACIPVIFSMYTYYLQGINYFF